MAVNTATLISTYTDDEIKFLEKKAEKRGMTTDQYQKDAALNANNKRYKDKKLNQGLIEVTATAVKLQDAIENKDSKSQLELANELIGKIGEVRCSL